MEKKRHKNINKRAENSFVVLKNKTKHIFFMFNALNFIFDEFFMLFFREVEKFGISKYKPSWLSSSHILYNEYLLVICFVVVVMAIIIYIRRLKLCSPKLPRSDMSRVPSMSYFMTDVDQVEQGVRLMNDYTYP